MQRTDNRRRPALRSLLAKQGRQTIRADGFFQSEIGNRKLKISSRGQAMAEYVIIVGLLMAALGILTFFFVTFKEYGGRILALVASEYP
ncbi:MAG: hypothetical protein KJ964_03470 [Verrucomicrobia bacterium]|nr:hypothetical protein [Verrucomicrobiota bacterium]MBU1736451.1 hypothetical protein [Verrucomicrobiota bacterium]MBU1857218.1 hypothetical protein [Verrucomicrobiota bacterium]